MAAALSTVKLPVRLKPVAFIAVLLVAWHVAANHQSFHILPGPLAVLSGMPSWRNAVCCLNTLLHHCSG